MALNAISNDSMMTPVIKPRVFRSLQPPCSRQSCDESAFSVCTSWTLSRFSPSSIEEDFFLAMWIRGPVPAPARDRFVVARPSMIFYRLLMRSSLGTAFALSLWHELFHQFSATLLWRKNYIAFVCTTSDRFVIFLALNAISTTSMMTPVIKPRFSRSLQVFSFWQANLVSPQRGFSSEVHISLAGFRSVRARHCWGFCHHPWEKIPFLSFEFMAVLLLMQEIGLLLPDEVCSFISSLYRVVSA